MNKNSIILILLLCCITTLAYAQGTVSKYGDFPFESSLQTAEDKAHIVTSNADLVTGLGVRLTTKATQDFGSMYIKDYKITSTLGVVIEFEYMMYDGTGGDGLCMFLFNAKNDNPGIGAPGAAIGYSYSHTTNGVRGLGVVPNENPGLSDAYIGVALDLFGNFKQLRYQGEDVIGGIPFYGVTGAESVEGAKNKEFNIPNQVTIRGAYGRAMNTTVTTSQGSVYVNKTERNTGYPVLVTQPTNSTVNGIKLDAEGKYVFTSATAKNTFKISDGIKFNSEKEPAYRKAIIELYPATDAGGGFYVTVKIQHGMQTDEIISDYHYKTSLKYPENALIANLNNKDIPVYSPPIFTLNSSIPEFLRIGFAASTGKETNNHVIKNVKVTLPGSAEAHDDSTETRTNTANPVAIRPFSNDVAYKGVIKKDMVGDSANIDPYSFRFFDGTNIHELAGGATTLTCTVKDQGTWKYDAQTSQVYFTPVPGFKGKATMQYSIKGFKGNVQKGEGDYADEAYRSTRATITVDVADDNPEPPGVAAGHIISNRMITVRYKK